MLRQIDFTALKPKLVLFEAYNLPPDELGAAQTLLAWHSYHLINYGKDTLAVHDAWWQTISGASG